MGISPTLHTEECTGLHPPQRTGIVIEKQMSIKMRSVLAMVTIIACLVTDGRSFPKSKKFLVETEDDGGDGRRLHGGDGRRDGRRLHGGDGRRHHGGNRRRQYDEPAEEPAVKPYDNPNPDPYEPAEEPAVKPYDNPNPDPYANEPYKPKYAESPTTTTTTTTT